jgi:hypothetical protein
MATRIALGVGASAVAVGAASFGVGYAFSGDETRDDMVWWTKVVTGSIFATASAIAWIKLKNKYYRMAAVMAMCVVMILVFMVYMVIDGTYGDAWYWIGGITVLLAGMSIAYLSHIGYCSLPGKTQDDRCMSY